MNMSKFFNLNLSQRAPSRARGLLLATVSSAMLMVAAANGAKALPAGGTSSQAVSITYGTTTTVNQSDARAIIDWTSFELAANETVNFVVPSSASSTLNRITGGGLTTIRGTVNSQGTVYFVNPNGMVFESSSRINTNGFAASTWVNSLNDFIPNGTIDLSSVPAVSTTAITAKGLINSIDYVGLYGPQVTVSGAITVTGSSGSVEIISHYRGISTVAITTGGGSVNLTSAGTLGTGAITTGGGSVALTSVAAMNLAAINTSSGSVTLNSGAGLTTAAITTGGGSVDMTSVGTIALNGIVNLGAGALTITNNAKDASTITNAADIIADRLTVTSSSKGSVSFNNVHIANLGAVDLSSPQGEKRFTLVNLRDLNVEGNVTIVGSLTLMTCGSANCGASSVGGSTYDLRINNNITVSQIRDVNGDPIYPAGTSGDLTTISSAGNFTSNYNITVYGNANLTAANNVTLNAELATYKQHVKATSRYGTLKVTSSNGSITSRSLITGESALSITSATKMTLSDTQSNGAITLNNSTSAASLYGDIELNGKVGRINDEGINLLTIINYAGNVLVNNSVVAEGLISITANNGSVIQADDLDSSNQYMIRSNRGGVKIISTGSNAPEGIRVHNVQANAVISTNPATKRTVTAGIGAGVNDIELKADSDIIVDASSYAINSLSTNAGNISVTSLNGNIVTNGRIQILLDHQELNSNINLTGVAVTVNGAIVGEVAAQNTVAGYNNGTVAVNISSGADGIEINGAVTAVGTLTLAPSSGNVVLGSGASLTANSAQQYDSATPANLIYTTATPAASRGRIVITGRNLTTASSASMVADHQISVSMSGNIKIGDSNSIKTTADSSEAGNTGGLYTDQSVTLSTAANKQLKIGSGSSVIGDSIVITGGIVTLGGSYATYGTTSDLGSIKVNSSTGNILFDGATVTSAQKIAILAAGNVTGNSSSFTTGGTDGSFTIGPNGTALIGTVNMTSSTITAKSVQINARGDVMLDNSGNQIDRLVSINSNGGDIALSNGKELQVTAGTAFNTGGQVRSITVDVSGAMKLDGNVLLNGGNVKVNASSLVLSNGTTPAPSATKIGLQYYNNNNNFTYNGTQIPVTINAAPAANVVRAVDSQIPQ